MASQNALEQLLPELQRQILVYSDSLATLYDLIRSSPRLYQVFRINREYIVSSIARRLFPGAATRHVLLLDKLSRIEDPPFSRQNVLKFFEDVSNQRSRSMDAVLSFSLSIKLCRLDATIRFFVRDYSQNTLPILTQLGESTSFSIGTHCISTHNDSYLQLSSLELNRLRRAFFTFEIYRQLFSRCSPNLDHETRRCLQDPSLTVFEQGQMFFQSISAYKVAEVACIRDYLCRRLRGIFDLVEDAAVAVLQAECPHPESKEQAMDWDSDTGDRYGYFEEDEGHLFTYLGKSDQKYHIEHLLSLGLPYIQKILKASGPEREELLLRYHVSCDAQYERQFLTASLGLDSLASRERTYGWPKTKMLSYLDEDKQSQEPPGWLWAPDDGYHLGLVDKAFKGLRDWGYVFWDQERLQRAGILQRNPRDLLNIIFNEHQAARKPSVQERWMGPPSFRDFEMEDTEGSEGDEEGEEAGHSGDDVYEEVDSTEATHTTHKTSLFIAKVKQWMQHAVGTLLKVVRKVGRYGRRCVTGALSHHRSGSDE